MRDFYPLNRVQKNSVAAELKKTTVKLFYILLLSFILVPNSTNAQVVYTVVEGAFETVQTGPNPFATAIRNQRSQYLYVGEYLLAQNAPNGFITSIAFKITNTAFPLNVKPQNLQIKMGLTDNVTLPETLVDNLATYYSSSIENVNTIGWHTIVLDTPFAWNGYSNIIVEVCRTNVNIGTNFSVEATILNDNEYRTVFLSSNTEAGNGCTLEGSTTLTLPNRRTLPSMQFTMTNPCSGTPIPGEIAVTGQNYCQEPFTLSIINDSTDSDLVYQWQSTSDLSIPFQDILNGTDNTLTTTQQFGTYYRRSVSCVNSGGIVAFSPGFYVGGGDCLCNPSVTFNNNAGISSVVFETINNQSTTENSYSNFAGVETSVQLESSTGLDVKVNTVNGALTTKAWFDWNRNQIFEESEGFDLGTSASAGENISSGAIANVIVPSNLLLGAVKMRIRTAKLQEGEILTPCGNFDSGETEDYTVVLTENLGLGSHLEISNSIVVISDYNEISVRSTMDPIESIKVYDLRGRLLHNRMGVNDNQTSISLNAIAAQLLIVEIKTASGTIVNRKINVR